MRILGAALIPIFWATCIPVLAQGPASAPSRTPLAPAAPSSVGQVTQGQLAVAVAAKLGLGDKLTEQRAIGLLAAHGIVPSTGWNRERPATDIFLVETQRMILLVLADVARNLGIPVPSTLGLLILTPGYMGGQTFAAVRPGNVSAARAAAAAAEADKLSGGETTQASIETPHPYPIGDDQFPVVWSYRLRVPGASFIKLHFSRLELAERDSIRVLDRYGQEGWKLVAGSPQTDVWSNAVGGDTAVIVIHAERSGWGFKIDRYSHGTLAR